MTEDLIRWITSSTYFCFFHIFMLFHLKKKKPNKLDLKGQNIFNGVDETRWMNGPHNLHVPLGNQFNVLIS